MDKNRTEGTAMRRTMLMLAAGLLLGWALAVMAGSAPTTVPFHDPNNLPRYNPNAEWRKVPCQPCDGKGFQVRVYNDVKRNRTIRYLVPCPYCKGKGYTGMSKM